METLTKLRKARGLSQQAFAGAAGLSMSVVQKLEQGRITNPSLDTLRGLAKGLSLTLEETIDQLGLAETEGAVA